MNADAQTTSWEMTHSYLQAPPWEVRGLEELNRPKRPAGARELMERFEDTEAAAEFVSAKRVRKMSCQKQGSSDPTLGERRKNALDVLRTLELLEQEPGIPTAVLDMIPRLREHTLNFLSEDAEERNVPNDDH